jgi:hypothetical protein
MTSGTHVFRALLIYGLSLPLAVFLGYSLATPMDLSTFAALATVLFLLLAPILLRWHHTLLIISWNMSAVVFFLPGRPNLWLVMALASLILSVVQRSMDSQQRLQNVGSLTWPLVYLAAVVLMTAYVTGGIGFRVFGGETYGGRKYFTLLGAIVGYFALSCQQVPPERGLLYSSLFFLSGATIAIGSLILIVDPAFYFIFWVFPVERLPGFGGGAADPAYMRITGLGFASIALVAFMLCRYGVREIFASGKWWRILAFFGFIVVGLYGGFRSTVILLLMTFVIQFCLEGLLRSRLLPIFAVITVVGGAALIPLVPRLPPTFQRSLSFLPLDIDPVVRADAQSSSEWRVKMWSVLWPEVPKHLMLGQGYSVSGSELELVATRAGGGSFGEEFGGAALAGDYHNGPLSILVPFGIWGAFGFLWFLIAGVRALYRNYRYGDPHLRVVNAFLLASFLAQVCLFFGVFGSLYGDMAKFAGLLGLSVTLNGGLRQPVSVPMAEEEKPASFASVLPRPRPVFGR